MPSGAKKRKAAKKKKEQQANNNNNNSSSLDNSSPRGNEDPKSQDERESDGGEVGSPVSQDHHNEQHPFNEENEESEKSLASDCKPIDDAERIQEVGVGDDTVVRIERELNPEHCMESKDISVEHGESGKELYDGYEKNSSSSSSSSSSCCSSDDEPQTLDKKRKEEVLDSALDNVEKVLIEEVTKVLGIEKPLKEANGNSIAETVPTVDLITQVVPKEANHVIDGAAFGKLDVLDVVEPGSKENEEKLLQESSGVTSSLVPEKNKDNLFHVLHENVGASTNMVSSATNGNEDKALAVSGAHFSETITYAENIKESETVNGNVVVNEPKTLTSSVAHTFGTSNDADKAKAIETSEYAETQPLVPQAPQVSQRTSWMSCCGLFDLFTGSNR